MRRLGDDRLGEREAGSGGCRRVSRAARVPPASVSTSARPLNMALSLDSCPVRVRSVV